MNIIDKILEPYTKTSIDVCYTDIVPPFAHRMPWHPKWRMLKWSKLLSWSKYDEIRDRAKKVFDIMEENGALCPNVSFYDVGGLKLEWANERGKRVVVLVAPQTPFQYGRCWHADDL